MKLARTVLSMLFSLLLISPAFAADLPTLTHGPILGLPAADSMRVWARTSVPATFDVRYGAAPEKLDQRSKTVTTSLDHDNTGWVTLEGLKPATRYHYRVYVGDLPQGQFGTFRTLPAAAKVASVAHNPKGLFNFRFEIGCCANQAPEHGLGHAVPTYSTMLRDIRDRIDFAIMNGDWLYEEQREYPPAAWQAVQGVTAKDFPRIVSIAPTLVGLWENYKLYLTRAPNLAAWHRNVPSLFTIDDHEIVNDIWGTGEVGHRHRRTVYRDTGVQAWHDYLAWANPAAYNHPAWFGRGEFKADGDLLVDRDADFTRLPLNEMSNLHVHWGKRIDGVNDLKYDDDSGHPNSRVYEIVKVVDKTTLQIRPPAKVADTCSYSIGRRNYGRFRVSNCEILLLDTRSHREMHDVQERDKPGLSMLGKPQYDWLVETMRKSDADFFFVVSSVPFTIPHIGAGGFEMAGNKDESWTVFLDEREKLINFWETLQKPVFVMTGDLHNSFAIKITDRVWEFCCGPHNSVNHVPRDDEGDRPATGPFQFGPRPIDIRWSSYTLPDVPRASRNFPFYCVVQVNNAFDNPPEPGAHRWVAYPHPQVVFSFYDGRTGELQYAEAVTKR